MPPSRRRPRGADSTALRRCARSWRPAVVSTRGQRLLVRKLVAGVTRLHEQDLAHYDLKPENILIVEGEPKIGDVGLVGPLEVVPAHSGTPLYMTPQGAADDLYGAGRILYELVSGRPSGNFPRLPAELVSVPSAEPVGSHRDHEPRVSSGRGEALWRGRGTRGRAGPRAAAR